MNKTIVVVGLGYVGLPLAVEFGKKFQTFGFDIDKNKILKLEQFNDPNSEVSSSLIRSSKFLKFSANPNIIRKADIIIITVPTPVTESKFPDFSFLVSASELVGQKMKKGAVVVYESTVYPGATEDICIPVLESNSKLSWKKDFFVGYSPERVNPGDKSRTITNITKVVSADSKKTLKIISDLYDSVIEAGVYEASSIQVAEAAKVIENTQRDLNIALINELSIIFNKLNLDTEEILNAAATKWNFLPFKPGLVGGHCIGVDPYYLTYKSEMIGYHPQVILAGRRINDGMPKYIVNEIIKKVNAQNFNSSKLSANVLGLTFKENCSDIRNSKVAELVRELEDYNINVKVHDPYADSVQAKNEYSISLVKWDKIPPAEILILAVPHDYYTNIGLEKIIKKMKKEGLFIDIKSAFNKTEVLNKRINFWRL